MGVENGPVSMATLCPLCATTPGPIGSESLLMISLYGVRYSTDVSVRGMMLPQLNAIKMEPKVLTGHRAPCHNLNN